MKKFGVVVRFEVETETPIEARTEVLNALELGNVSLIPHNVGSAVWDMETRRNVGVRNGPVFGDVMEMTPFTPEEMTALIEKVGREFHEDRTLRAAVQKLAFFEAALR